MIFDERSSPRCQQKPFFVTERTPQSLIYMGFIPLPLVYLEFLCLSAEEVARGGLVRFLEEAVCNVNTSNYSVPV